MVRVKQPQFGDKFPSTEAILRLLGAGALLSMSIFVPTFPMIVAPFINQWKEYDRRRLRDQIGRLKKRHLIEIAYEGDQTIVKLTEKGKLKVLRYRVSDMKINKPKKWDGKWRIICFDVAEKKKNLRDAFRSMVRSLGFYPLQKSVFIYPYPCRDEIEFLRQIYGVGNEVLYLIVNDIEDDGFLRSYFEL